MNEDGAEDGSSSQRSTVNTTGVQDGQAGTALTFGSANIENLSIHTTQQGSVGSGHSRQVPEDPERDEYRNAVQITLRGYTLSRATILETIQVHNGKVSIRGNYNDQDDETTEATCKEGKIVQLQLNCGRQQTTDATCRTKWTLYNIAIGALSKLMEFNFKGLRDITCAFKNTFGVLWMLATSGSLVLEFGHGTKQDAEEMVSNKDAVTHLLTQLLGKCNIHDAFTVDNVEVMDECDDVTELPSTSTGKGLKRVLSYGHTGYHHAASQSDSGIYSVSSGGAHAQADHQVDPDPVLGELSIDEGVDGCDACRDMSKYKDPDVTTNQFVIHIDVVMTAERTLRRLKERRVYNRKKQFEMSMKASALRNSGGGAVFCHLSGKNKINRCLEHFDEMFLNPQTFDLGEGEIFSHEIQRKWFEDTDFLVITVSQCISTRVSTASVNSYTSDYCYLAAASLPQIKTLIFGKCAVGHRRPVVRGLENLQTGVDIQLRSLKLKEHLTIKANTFKSLSKHGLHKYISAFSKNRSGGSFYIGVREGEIGPIIEGVDITSKDHTAFTEALRRFVQQNLMIIPNIHFHESNSLTDLVDVTFHPVSEDKSVIEFSVRPVNGCVFTDKGGPSAYKLDEKGGLRRMTCQEWMQKIQPAE